MLKVGLTGGIAGGKSTVCALFSEYDIPIIDADIIARQLVAPNQDALQEIVQTFGTHVLQKEGYLNRQVLRQIIFSDDIAKQQLENILHPKIRQQIQLQSNQIVSPYCIIAIPLLIEAKMHDLVDRILVIDIEPSLQLNRLCHRDDISVTEAQTIISKQCSPSQRLTAADDIINNNSSHDELVEQVHRLHQQYANLTQDIAN